MSEYSLLWTMDALMETSWSKRFQLQELPFIHVVALHTATIDMMLLFCFCINQSTTLCINFPSHTIHSAQQLLLISIQVFARACQCNYRTNFWAWSHNFTSPLTLDGFTIALCLLITILISEIVCTVYQKRKNDVGQSRKTKMNQRLQLREFIKQWFRLQSGSTY